MTERSGGTSEDEKDDRARPQILSARELQVIELIVQGYSARQVAEELSLSTRTIERHIDNVRNKLNARNRPHLVRKAIELGEVRIRTNPK